MTRRGLAIGWLLPGLLSLVTLGPSCEQQEAGTHGTISLALATDGSDFFRLRIMDGPADAALEGEQLYTTECLRATARTYDVTDIPVGAERSVVFEAFSGDGASECAERARIELGYRGGVEVIAEQMPYYHIPLYTRGAVTALPEELNLSASSATRVPEAVESCEMADCSGVANAICYDQTPPTLWCVPTCLSDEDCSGIHPGSSCDTNQGWCMLYSPFPLNLSETRAMGRAVTLANGDVAFIAGVGGAAGDTELPATRHFIEVFDADQGLFAAAGDGGLTSWPAALFGFAELGADRFALVGGVARVSVNWKAEAFDLEIGGSALSDAVVVTNPHTGRATASSLPGAVAVPAVVSLGADRFLVAGGFVADESGGRPTRDAWICTVDGDLGVTCEGIAPMNKARARAAAQCLDVGCEQVLILGGNDGGAIAEVLDTAGTEPTFRPLSAEGLGAGLFDAELCGMTLMAGSGRPTGPSTLRPATLELSGDALKATPLDATDAPTLSWFPAVTRAQDDCWVLGGLEAGGSTRAVVQRLRSGALTTDYTLNRGRFGAMAATIGSGPLAGMVIVGGGLRVPMGDGAAIPVRGAEVLSP